MTRHLEHYHPDKTGDEHVNKKARLVLGETDSESLQFQLLDASSAYVKPGVGAEDWVPAEILFWSRDALPVVKELVGDESLAKDMKWAPEKL